MKKDVLVVYRSKYGSTKRYAEWIAKGCDADLFDLSEFDPSRLAGYGTVLFGSSVRAGRIKHIGFVKKNWEVLKKKKFVIFTATGAPSDDPGQMKVFESSLPAEIRKKTKYFPLHGAFDFNKLTGGDRFMMAFPEMIIFLKWWFKRDEKSKKDLEDLKKPQDWTSEKAIVPIVEFVKTQKG